MPKGIPLTEEDQQRRRHEVFNASVALFLEKGFRETSMQEIAAAAGMGKSTLYDYFKTKDEILVSFVEDAIYDLTEQVRQIVGQDCARQEGECQNGARQDGAALAKLRLALRAHLDYLLANKEFFNKLSFEVQRLDADSQRRIQIQRHAYQDMIGRLIEQAVAEGTFRPVNPLLAARTLLALTTPAVYTSRPTGTPEQMMDEVLDIFYHGVMNRPG